MVNTTQTLWIDFSLFFPPAQESQIWFDLKLFPLTFTVVNTDYIIKCRKMMLNFGSCSVLNAPTRQWRKFKCKSIPNISMEVESIKRHVRTHFLHFIRPISHPLVSCVKRSKISFPKFHFGSQFKFQTHTKSWTKPFWFGETEDEIQSALRLRWQIAYLYHMVKMQE